MNFPNFLNSIGIIIGNLSDFCDQQKIFETIEPR